MENYEFVARLEKYQKQTNEEWGEIARDLGVTAASIINWRNGCSISMKNRKAILVLTEGIEPLPVKTSNDCQINNCPIRKSTDRLLQIVLETWAQLDVEDKADVVKLILKSIEKNKISNL